MAWQEEEDALRRAGLSDDDIARAKRQYYDEVVQADPGFPTAPQEDRDKLKKFFYGEEKKTGFSSPGEFYGTLYGSANRGIQDVAESIDKTAAGFQKILGGPYNPDRPPLRFGERARQLGFDERAKEMEAKYHPTGTLPSIVRAVGSLAGELPKIYGTMAAGQVMGIPAPITFAAQAYLESVGAGAAQKEAAKNAIISGASAGAFGVANRLASRVSGAIAGKVAAGGLTGATTYGIERLGGASHEQALGPSAVWGVYGAAAHKAGTTVDNSIRERAYQKYLYDYGVPLGETAGEPAITPKTMMDARGVADAVASARSPVDLYGKLRRMNDGEMDGEVAAPVTIDYWKALRGDHPQLKIMERVRDTVPSTSDIRVRPGVEERFNAAMEEARTQTPTELLGWGTAPEQQKLLPRGSIPNDVRGLSSFGPFGNAARAIGSNGNPDVLASGMERNRARVEEMRSANLPVVDQESLARGRARVEEMASQHGPLPNQIAIDRGERRLNAIARSLAEGSPEQTVSNVRQNAADTSGMTLGEIAKLREVQQRDAGLLSRRQSLFSVVDGISDPGLQLRIAEKLLNKRELAAWKRAKREAVAAPIANEPPTLSTNRPDIVNIPKETTNAEAIRGNEGQVYPTGTEPGSGPGEGGKDLQLAPPEVSAAAESSSAPWLPREIELQKKYGDVTQDDLKNMSFKERWLAQVAEIDRKIRYGGRDEFGRVADDLSYRSILSSGSKHTLKRGDTWRNLVIRYAEGGSSPSPPPPRPAQEVAGVPTERLQLNPKVETPLEQNAPTEEPPSPAADAIRDMKRGKWPLSEDDSVTGEEPMPVGGNSAASSAPVRSASIIGDTHLDVIFRGMSPEERRTVVANATGIAPEKIKDFAIENLKNAHAMALIAENRGTIGATAELRKPLRVEADRRLSEMRDNEAATKEMYGGIPISSEAALATKSAAKDIYDAFSARVTRVSKMGENGGEVVRVVKNIIHRTAELVTKFNYEATHSMIGDNLDANGNVVKGLGAFSISKKAKEAIGRSLDGRPSGNEKIDNAARALRTRVLEPLWALAEKTGVKNLKEHLEDYFSVTYKRKILEALTNGRSPEQEARHPVKIDGVTYSSDEVRSAIIIATKMGEHDIAKLPIDGIRRLGNILKNDRPLEDADKEILRALEERTLFIRSLQHAQSRPLDLGGFANMQKSRARLIIPDQFREMDAGESMDNYIRGASQVISVAQHADSLTAEATRLLKFTEHNKDLGKLFYEDLSNDGKIVADLIRTAQNKSLYSPPLTGDFPSVIVRGIRALVPYVVTGQALISNTLQPAFAIVESSPSSFARGVGTFFLDKAEAGFRKATGQKQRTDTATARAHSSGAMSEGFIPSKVGAGVWSRVRDALLPFGFTERNIVRTMDYIIGEKEALRLAKRALVDLNPYQIERIESFLGEGTAKTAQQIQGLLDPNSETSRRFATEFQNRVALPMHASELPSFWGRGSLADAAFILMKFPYQQARLAKESTWDRGFGLYSKFRGMELNAKTPEEAAKYRYASYKSLVSGVSRAAKLMGAGGAAGLIVSQLWGMVRDREESTDFQAIINAIHGGGPGGEKARKILGLYVHSALLQSTLGMAGNMMQRGYEFAFSDTAKNFSPAVGFVPSKIEQFNSILTLPAGAFSPDPERQRETRQKLLKTVEGLYPGIAYAEVLDQIVLNQDSGNISRGEFLGMGSQKTMVKQAETSVARGIDLEDTKMVGDALAKRRRAMSALLSQQASDGDINGMKRTMEALTGGGVEKYEKRKLVEAAIKKSLERQGLNKDQVKNIIDVITEERGAP